LFYLFGPLSEGGKRERERESHGTPEGIAKVAKPSHVVIITRGAREREKKERKRERERETER